MQVILRDGKIHPTDLPFHVSLKINLIRQRETKCLCSAWRNNQHCPHTSRDPFLVQKESGETIYLELCPVREKNKKKYLNDLFLPTESKGLYSYKNELDCVCLEPDPLS
ncbi:hypothetical protein CDAR_517141 [Caerostris darwini]|uniref:SWIM-type domain-containing protein n=1 Tax=Caerostris darwini TaxID=1538125 RepID=A0AAV4S4Q1_9ARAC|nr:hypothetical protein CDAR_517141 [Caerostris darwini]